MSRATSPSDHQDANRATARRGRPTILHDNRRVQALMVNFDSVTSLVEFLPKLDDALIGITHLQTEGQASTRPLSKRMLHRVLRGCAVISTNEVAIALGRNYSPAAVHRYTAHARTASKVLANLLDHHPCWEVDAARWAAEATEYDQDFTVPQEWGMSDRA